jgi:hypothetical protein
MKQPETEEEIKEEVWKPITKQDVNLDNHYFVRVPNGNIGVVVAMETNEPDRIRVLNPFHDFTKSLDTDARQYKSEVEWLPENYGSELWETQPLMAQTFQDRLYFHYHAGNVRGNARRRKISEK